MSFWFMVFMAYASNEVSDELAQMSKMATGSSLTGVVVFSP